MKMMNEMMHVSYSDDEQCHIEKAEVKSEGTHLHHLGSEGKLMKIADIRQ